MKAASEKRAGLGPLLTAILLGVYAICFVAAYPPVNAWPLAILAPVPLVIAALHGRSGRVLYGLVFVAQMAIWLWLSRWMVQVTMAGYPALAAYLSIFTVLFVWLMRRIDRCARLRRLPMTIVVPIVWTGVECFRGEFLFDGYPWFLLGHPLIGWPVLVQSADLFGSYTASILAAAIAGLIVDAWRRLLGVVSRRAIQACTLIVVGIQLANILYGYGRINQESASSDAPSLRVLGIQTNLPQDNKMGWSIEQQVRDIPEFIAMTRRAFETTGSVDLIVWPETMLPGIGLEAEVLAEIRQRKWVSAALADLVIEMQQSLGVPMIVGSPAYLGVRITDELQWDRHYNSAYLLQGDPPFQRYDKFFLTPFGETMPYISNWPWLEQTMLDFGAAGMTFELDAAEEIARLKIDVPGAGRPIVVGTPICFEDTVGRVCRKMAYPDGEKAIDFFINISNDGWFGEYAGGRLQHAQIARFRCIENRVPMFRAVNTGWTVAINSAGEFIAAADGGRSPSTMEPGWLAAELWADQRRTLYGRLGDSAAWSCLFAMIGLLVMTFVPGRSMPPAES